MSREKLIYVLITCSLLLVADILLILLQTSDDLVQRKVNVYFVDNDIEISEEAADNSIYEYDEVETQNDELNL